MNRMNNSLRKFVLLFAACQVIGSLEAVAAPVYSQRTPADPGGAFTSLDVPDGQRIADNFMLSGVDPVTVRSIRFIGAYGLTAPPPITPPLDALPIDAFRVTFFEDAAGLPGQPLVAGDLEAIVFRRNPTGGPLFSGVFNPIDFAVNIPGGITLEPSTVYWLSIANNPGPDHAWVWGRGDGTFDGTLVSTVGDIESGPWSIGSGGGMNFELDTAPIPEPSIVTLSAAAIVFAFSRSTHRINSA